MTILFCFSLSVVSLSVVEDQFDGRKQKNNLSFDYAQDDHSFLFSLSVVSLSVAEDQFDGRKQK
ncbi:hypothetical protein GCM10022246_36430 [Pedobacter ginsengiterrae]|uniref:Uncharacterized protein n=1 Tax=Pedobacter ginsengiterrae TaxID=871696 RepID=A0ABP7QEC2_9SPHI